MYIFPLLIKNIIEKMQLQIAHFPSIDDFDSEDEDIVFNKIEHWLRNGGDINEKDGRGFTVLDHVILYGFVKTARYLLGHGANINSEYLNDAILNEDIDMATTLLEYGANINQPYTSGVYLGQTPLFLASDIDTMDWLIKNGANVNHTLTDGPYIGQSPLFFAVAKDDINMVRLLIKNGANVNYTLPDGTTPLYLAVAKNDIKMARLLIDNGANIDARSLEEAAKNKYKSIIMLFIEKGANIDNVRDEKARDYLRGLKIKLPFNDCNNSIDYITQDEWSDAFSPNVKITFVDGSHKNVQCYDKESLLQWIQNRENIIYKWIPNRIGGNILSSGLGGGPSKRAFLTLFTREYIDNDSIKKILLPLLDNPEPVELTAFAIGKNVLLGKRFGISETHGQDGFTIYKLSNTSDSKNFYINHISENFSPDTPSLNKLTSEELFNLCDKLEHTLSKDDYNEAGIRKGIN